MSHAHTVGITIAILVTAAQAAAQSVAAGDITLRLTGRINVQFNTTSVDEQDLGPPTAPGSVTVPGSQFEIRRARIALELAAADWITGIIEPDVAMANLELKRAWLNFGFSDALQLRAGQFKKPFSLIELTSSLEMPVIERDLAIRHLVDAAARADLEGGSPVLGRFQGDPVLGEEQYLLDAFGYTGYDVGAMVHGEAGGFRYQAGLFNGAGPDAADDTDGKAWAARLTWDVPLRTPVTIGTAVSYSERSAGPQELAEGTSYGLDLELGAFRRNGMHVLAEVVSGSSLAVDEQFLAGHVMAAWWVSLSGRRMDGVELAARVSRADPNRGVSGDSGTLFSAGANLYLHGQQRLMLNWETYAPQGDRFARHSALRAQAQVAF